MQCLYGGLLVLSLALVTQLSQVQGENPATKPTCDFTVNITANGTDVLIPDNTTAGCSNFMWTVKALDEKMKIVVTFVSVVHDNPHSVVVIDSDDVNFVYSFDDPDIQNKVIVTNLSTLQIQRVSLITPSKTPLFTLKVWAQEFGGVYTDSPIFIGPNFTKPIQENYYFALTTPQQGQQVSVKINKLNNNGTAIAKFYDGFSNKSELAQFVSKDELYPVFSTKNEMLVVLNKFIDGQSFDATVTADSPDRNSISESSSDVWVLRNQALNGNYTWIIKPSSVNESDLISLSINFLNILPKSSFVVYEGLSTTKSKIVLNLNHSLSNQRSLYVKASSGIRLVYAVVEKSTINSDDAVVSMSYDVVKGCSGEAKKPESQIITSPGYPSQYYFNSDCEWNFENDVSKTYHFHFNDYDLSLNDTIILSVNNVSRVLDSPTEDFVAVGEKVKIEFKSTTNGLSQLPKRGFSLSININDFGSPVLAPRNITTPKIITPNSNATWLVTARRNQSEVNNIHITINTVPGKTPALTIYDGSNTSVSKLNYKFDKSGVAMVVSRINMLVIHYEAGKDPIPFNATFEPQDCDVNERCDNGICMHPEWRCNQIDECGDYSDEKNCLKCEDCGNQHVNVTAAKVTIMPNYTKTGGVINCCWFFTADAKQTIEARFTELTLSNPTDLLVVLDGDNKLETLNSDSEELKDVLLTTGNKLTVNLFSQKLVSNSTFTLEVKSQDIGRKIVKEGDVDIPAQQPENKTILFEFEADPGQQVGVNLTLGKDTADWNVTFYDGYNPNQLPLAVRASTIQNYPVISRSNKMLVVAKDFHGPSTAKFSFKSIPSGYFFVNQTSTGSIYLSEVATKPFYWQIRPQSLRKDNKPARINLEINNLELVNKDTLTIVLDDDREINVATFTKSIENGKVIQVLAKSGMYIKYSSPTKNGTMSFVASYEVVAADNVTYNLESRTKQNITSPSYPNTYPVNAIGEWIVNVPKGNILHVYFDTFDVDVKHALTIQANNSKEIISFAGQKIPDDLLFTETPVTIKWNSTKFDENSVLGKGFRIYLEVYDCGGNLTKDSDAIKTPKFPSDVNTTLHCMWIMSLPNATDNKPNMINFTVTNDNKDYVTIHDGGSLRFNKFENYSDHSMLSRNSKLLVTYLFDKNTKVPAVKGLEINYHIIGCTGKTCANNGTCIHPDWLCNHVNDCGDNTDEIFCPYHPEPPPTPAPTGVSKGWLAGGIILGLLFGAILAIAIPILYQKYTGRSLGYQRFGGGEAT